MGRLSCFWIHKVNRVISNSTPHGLNFFSNKKIFRIQEKFNFTHSIAHINDLVQTKKESEFIVYLFIKALFIDPVH